jgi:LmbE family N-acetylglucosaminyl deacetylase
MTAADYFTLVQALPILDWRAITMGRPFAVLSPHPDDESLGAGGLIALARGMRQEVMVLLLTDGSQSHPNSRVYPRDRLIATRRDELHAAGRILGLSPAAIHEIGFTDAAVPDTGPALDAAIDRILALLARHEAESLFVTWAFDPHCDHEAAARLALELRLRRPSLKLWWYPVWGWHLPPSHMVPAPLPAGARLAIAPVLEQKRAAIAAHRSQTTDLIEDDPDGFRLMSDIIAPFLGPFEYFIAVPPP